MNLFRGPVSNLPFGFTEADCEWLCKNGIDYRDYYHLLWLREQLRKQA